MKEMSYTSTPPVGRTACIRVHCASVCIQLNMRIKCCMIIDPVYVEQQMTQGTLRTKTRITGYRKGILKFRRHEISGNICSYIGLNELRNDISSGNVHVSHRATCRRGGEMNTSSDLRHSQQLKLNGWVGVGGVVNVCIELFRLNALQYDQRICRPTRTPCVNCWSALLLSLGTEIDFNIST
jgi:hypothetical protein